MAVKRKMKKTGKIIIGIVSALCLALAGVLAWVLTRPPVLNKQTRTASLHELEVPIVDVPKVEETSATLFAVGDGLLHEAVYYWVQQPDGSYEFKPMVDRIGEIARGYDLRYYNQETILGGSELGLSHYPTFNSPQEFGVNMIEEGFNLVSTATNHTLDAGVAGVENSWNFWHSHEDEILMQGTNLSWEQRNEIPVREVNGITYSFLSWTFGMNGFQPPEGMEYLVNCYTGHEEEMLDQVRQAKEKADVVIMAIHWGTEYADYPNDEQISLAQQLSDAGCDIIIGNHPHMIQPVQWINGHKTICFYAMGNLLSAQFDDSLVGMMGAVKINKKTTGGKTEITLSDVKADLHWTYGEVNNWHDIRVIPFAELDESLCPGYQELYARMSKIITAMDDSIQVGGF